MCGIIGFINAMPLSGTTGERHVSYLTKADDVMTNGVVACSVRGMDSTGVFQVNGKGKVFVHKLPVNASMFIQDKVSKQFLKDTMTSPITVFHTRAATEGRVNLNNAHPFTALDSKNRLLVGVHNGTLSGWKSAKDSGRFEVDSEWAMNRLAQDPFDAFEDFRGAWSFVYWKEEQPSVLYFARNKERPMWMLFTKNRKHAIFGSEPGMLSWIAQRENIDVEDTVYELPVDHAVIVDVHADTLEIKHAFNSQLPAPKTVYVPTGSYSSTTIYRDSRKDTLSATMAKILSEAAEAFRKGINTTAAPTAVQQPAAEIPFEAGEIAPLTPDMFDNGVATDSEKKMAEQEGLYGQVVAFTPTDARKNSVSGTITVLRNEGELAEADAFLRHGQEDLPLEAVVEQFAWVAIAGMYTVKDVLIYVLAPLNEMGEDTIADEVASYVSDDLPR